MTGIVDMAGMDIAGMGIAGMDMAGIGMPALVPRLVACGLAGAFAISLVEKLVPIIPSVGVYLMLGALFRADAATLAALVLVTACGSTAGSLFWFLVGRIGPGNGYLSSLAASLAARVSPRRTGRISTPLGGRRMGGAMIAVQVVPVARAYAGLAFSAAGARMLRFASATFAGCLIWNSALICLGATMALGWRIAG